MHHLKREDKQRAVRKVYRVLGGGGEYHIIDFGKPRGWYGHLASIFDRWLEQAADNVAGLLPVMISAAGFKPVEETNHYTTIFGTLAASRHVRHSRPQTNRVMDK